MKKKLCNRWASACRQSEREEIAKSNSSKANKTNKNLRSGSANSRLYCLDIVPSVPPTTTTTAHWYGCSAAMPLSQRATRPNIRKIRITSINKKIIRNEKCLASSTADASSSSPRESTTFVYVCRVGAHTPLCMPFVARLYIWITRARHRAQMVSVYVVVVVVRLFTKYTHFSIYNIIIIIMLVLHRVQHQAQCAAAAAAHTLYIRRAWLLF